MLRFAQHDALFFPALLTALVLALPCPAPAASDEADKERRDTYRELELFANVLTLVQQYYVDPVEMRGLMNGAVGGMLGSLDPYSGYLSPEDYQELEEETSGSFTGIGIVFGFIPAKNAALLNPIEALARE